MTIQFWSNEPSSLLDKDFLFELWPTSSMTYEQKLNAISRLILLLTVLGYVSTTSTRIVAVGVATLAIIAVLYHSRKPPTMTETFNTRKEVPAKPKTFINPVTLDEVLRTEFKEGTKKNPFSNVLLTQINDEPERKAAPPSFNTECDEDITKNVKRAVQMLNPGIKNTNKQLFGDMYQQFQLDNANRAFYSTPNTRVTNDAGSFGHFLYGNMPSAKEDTPDGNLQRVRDNARWIMM